MGEPTIGSTVGPYRLDALIGRGGMGVVYLATHTHLEARRAVKVLASEIAADDSFRERFIRESKLAASLDHPNVIPVYDAGEADGVLYVAMQFVDGADLSTVLGRERALGVDRTLAILSQVAGALDAAHGRGLVHRDVKPANVIIEAGTSERAFLTDFGLVRAVASTSALTGVGQFVGTSSYMAPEQIEGRPVDGRSDIYSLGCMMFECLTGEIPFPRDTEAALLWAHMSAPPPAPSERLPGLPASLDGVVQRAMAKSPADRFATCGEFIAAARAAVGARPVPATSPGVRPTRATAPRDGGPPGVVEPSRVSGRRWFAVAAVVVTTLALGAGLAVWATRTLGGDRNPGPSPSPGARARTSPAEVAATDVRIFTPFTSGRLDRGIVVERTVSGRCWTSSNSSTRSDAWRCMAGNEIHDPCFHGAVPASGHGDVVCIDAPWSSATVIQLTEALPWELAHDPDQPPEQASSPWALELADGRRCSFVSGATDLVANRRLSYACEPTGNVFDEPNRTGRVWKAFASTDQPTTLKEAEIRVAWF